MWICWRLFGLKNDIMYIFTTHLSFSYGATRSVPPRVIKSAFSQRNIHYFFWSLQSFLLRSYKFGEFEFLYKQISTSFETGILSGVCYFKLLKLHHKHIKLCTYICVNFYLFKIMQVFPCFSAWLLYWLFTWLLHNWKEIDSGFDLFDL